MGKYLKVFAISMIFISALNSMSMASPAKNETQAPTTKYLQTIIELKDKQLAEQSELLEMLGGSDCQRNSIASILRLPHTEPILAPCDSKIAGPGWIVIQRRIDGTESFNLNWEEYKKGFGDIKGEYFIGLEDMYLITQSQPHELYIHLEDFNNETRYARYSNFLIGSEEESYKLLQLGNYSGNASNIMQYHINNALPKR
ncbi:angiopoietin-related protein 1-like [Drosophila navojoa]|uniref:angiopoietin-related protein 1-like n=1 Tax=Drosophila navojoa TaxID=7232 RepID=UPI0011BEC59E|nr:angiopoietin-related protein 1-like [Drosophila navojoa]